MSGPQIFGKQGSTVDGEATNQTRYRARTFGLDFFCSFFWCVTSPSPRAFGPMCTWLASYRNGPGSSHDSGCALQMSSKIGRTVRPVLLHSVGDYSRHDEFIIIIQIPLNIYIFFLKIDK